MAIESKNLLVWVKAMSRGQALPLDASEIYDSLAAAETYAGSATAYAGQTIKAKLEDGKYHSYVLQPSEAGYTLEEVGAIKESDLKQYVQVVEALPESGQIQGVLYIKDTEGYVYTGSAWKKVFWDITADVTAVANRVKALEDEMPNKAPLANPVFTGTVKVGTEEVAVKSYVDGLISNLVSDTPGVLDESTYNEQAKLKAGQMFRVAAKGTYWGHACEPGDLIIVLADSDGLGPVAQERVMVIQANIDGAVTSTADAATVGEIVVFDAVTGKVIKGSGVQIASLNDAIAKAHEHANATQLATYDKTQAELLAAAKAEAESLVSAHETAVNTALDGKADKATTLAGYGITDAYNKTEIDGQLKTITDNLNTKISSTDADSKIATAKQEAIDAAQELVEGHEQAMTSALSEKADKATTLAGYGIGDAYTKTEVEGLITTSESGTDTKINNAKAAVLGDAKGYTDTTLSNRIGAIPADTTIYSYIEAAVGAGGTASAEAIATAKQEAINTSKGYTDTQINAALTVVEF